MTAGAVGLGTVTEALGRLQLGVAELALLLMAHGAARWVGRTYDLAVQHVALGARELMLNDVLLVANRGARALPSRLHVQALGWRT